MIPVDRLASFQEAEEATLGDLLLLMVAKQKPLGSKTDDQGTKESSAPSFILFVQVQLDNFPKITVGTWRAQVQKFRNTSTSFALLILTSSLPLV